MKLGGGKDSYRLKYTCAADLRSFQCLSLEKLANSMVCPPPTVLALLPGRILTSCCDNMSQPRRMSSSVLLGRSTWLGGLYGIGVSRSEHLLFLGRSSSCAMLPAAFNFPFEHARPGTLSSAHQDTIYRPSRGCR